MELTKIDLQKTSPASTPPQPGNPLTKDVNIKPMPSPENSSHNPILKIVLLLVALVLGVGSGYLLKKPSATLSTSSPTISRDVPASGLKEGDIVGIQDEKTFKDSATGVLQAGGLDGEGSHKLLRPGGASQTVYLTSSVIDLDQFVGNQVTIWGETFKGQKAAWLMDVGRVRVEKLNAANPD